MASASQACARDWEPGMLLGVHTASSCCIFPGHTSSSPECSRHPPAVSWGRDRSCRTPIGRLDPSTFPCQGSLHHLRGLRYHFGKAKRGQVVFSSMGRKDVELRVCREVSPG